MKVTGIFLMALVASISAVSLEGFYRHQSATKEVQGQVGKEWSNCGKSDDVIQLNTLKFTPDPPKRGQELKIEANLTTTSVISGGTIVVELKFDGIKLYDGKLDVCDSLKQGNFTCPLPPSNYAVTETTKIPSETPPGHYVGHAVATETNGKELACIDVDVHL